MAIIEEIKSRLMELPKVNQNPGSAQVARFEIHDARLGHSWFPLRFDGQDTMYCLWIAPLGRCGFRLAEVGEIFRVSSANDLRCYQLN